MVSKAGADKPNRPLTDRLPKAKDEEYESAAERMERHQQIRKIMQAQREAEELARREAEHQRLMESPYALQLYDRDAVDRRFNEVKTQRDTQQLQDILKTMQLRSCVSELVPQPEGFETILDGMLAGYPHFSPVIDFMRSRMRLNALKRHPALGFTANVLLVGPAGCGKSSFLDALGRQLGTKFASIACAAATNGFDLCGLSGGWGNGKSGGMHNLLVNEDCPNPIILLDEIDKAGASDEKFPFIGCLYGLLEPQNAKRFKDEFVGVEIDASRVSWFASANDVRLLDAPIKDRFEIIEVPAPDANDLRQIIPQLYRQRLVDHGLQEVFNPEIDSRLVDLLATAESTSIRRIKSMVDTALANAAARIGRTDGCMEITSTDLPEMGPSKQTYRIGFVH
ncbi:AAA family ATPase [Mariprofundus erugo]|uniref:AAA family ATPase n=1 Tax=Mariprofundus erugo TaxID=2528639 RepID=UPI0010FCFC92|nr:AAA family ATPase [Mariprofundus erugo]TLS78277.1 AAA family ATPase [Mariprofundus erugo]